MFNDKQVRVKVKIRVKVRFRVRVKFLMQTSVFRVRTLYICFVTSELGLGLGLGLLFEKLVT